MWRRLPTYFPNLRLSMLPLTEAQKQQLKECGWLREVAFRTEPRVNKLEIKAFLEKVHGMEVERVSTINYQGKRKRIIDDNGKPHYRRLTDWKKAYVIFKAPEKQRLEWEQQQREKAERQQQEEQQRRQQKQQLQRQARQGLLPQAAAAAVAAADKEAAAAATQLDR